MLWTHVLPGLLFSSEGEIHNIVSTPWWPASSVHSHGNGNGERVATCSDWHRGVNNTRNRPSSTCFVPIPAVCIFRRPCSLSHYYCCCIFIRWTFFHCVTLLMRSLPPSVFCLFVYRYYWQQHHNLTTVFTCFTASSACVSMRSNGRHLISWSPPPLTTHVFISG